MLDWLGDVTSTVSFCQLSGGVCFPMNLCVNFHASCSLMVRHGSVKLCIESFLNSILSMSYFVFVPCINFIHKFHQIFTPYGVSILIL